MNSDIFLWIKVAKSVLLTINYICASYLRMAFFLILDYNNKLMFILYLYNL